MMKKQIVMSALIVAFLTCAMVTVLAEEDESEQSSPSGRGYIFSFDIPRNMSQTIQPEGTFRGSGIAGSYTITERIITVIITEKPVLISYSLIEEQLKKLFEGLPATSLNEPIMAPFSSPIIITNYDVTYTYSTPDDLAKAIQTIRDYLEDQGINLVGNEQRGEFIVDRQTEGIYRVTGDTVTISMNLGSLFINTTTFSFPIDKPRDMSRAVKSVETEIAKHKGTLTGTNLEQEGSFRASGVVGSYIVTGMVDITINERPRIFSEDYIKDMVKEWFKDM
jgi:hypothetical protein